MSHSNLSYALLQGLLSIFTSRVGPQASQLFRSISFTEHCEYLAIKVQIILRSSYTKSTEPNHSPWLVIISCCPVELQCAMRTPLLDEEPGW